MPLLTISQDNTLLTLQPEVSNDVLDIWLTQAHRSHYRYLQLDVTRNCCLDKVQSFKVFPQYPFATDVRGFYLTVFPPVPFVNEAYVEFGMDGIDEELIASARVLTNENNIGSTTLTWVDKTAATIVSNSGTRIYYTLGGAPITSQVEITTIDGAIYTIDLLLTPDITIFGNNNDLSVTQFTVIPVPNIIVDYNATNIIFDMDSLGQTSADNQLLDGVYNIGISLVTITDTTVDSVNKFFNIRLNCIVTNIISDNITNNTAFMLLQALEISNDCPATASQQCTMYNALIRELILLGQSTKLVQSGNCGC